MYYQNSRKHATGVSLLLSVVFLWLISSFFTNNLLNDPSFFNPFFITYLNTGTFVLYLIPWYLFERNDTKRELTAHTSVYESLDETQNPYTYRRKPMTFRQTASLSLGFCIIWFAANYFSNGSLAFTNVASFTIISSMSGFFTLGLGAIFNVEKFTFGKLLALVASVGGVILVVIQDSKQASGGDNAPSQPALGNTFALLAAFLYGCYSVLVKFHITEEVCVSMRLFFGLVGLFDIILLWPFLILLHYYGVEKFQLPSTNRGIAILLFNAGITFVSDYLWVIAMLMTSPLLVTLGMSLSIPLALFFDIILRGHYINFTLIFGSLLVFAGFIVVNYNQTTHV
ncbi:membrane transporter [Schizosaccharomyces cryophilus OY26]|uniref:Membrane transporter n=1 Tax=Schizosaccharomyces cryophilus (strain OY26 / ATCC MYA-4695 / CBS 11777 / NBRC 106824 / NRRL Y48691) TaxID=653667 RepID=S9XJY4_SCHCR|nr:membrane transporter [Schizosaccharomyces cryophilus OY26]EPY54011.1 membrane transporter [Schizosaccharomyces cryophilus OY26]